MKHTLTTGIELEDLRELGLTPRLWEQKTRFVKISFYLGKPMLLARDQIYINDLEQFYTEVEQVKQSIKEINEILEKIV